MVFRYTPKERADIGKYAQLNRVPAAARHYSRKLGIHLSESTVQSMKDAYKVEVRKQFDEDNVIFLPVKKRGRSRRP